MPNRRALRGTETSKSNNQTSERLQTSIADRPCYSLAHMHKINSNELKEESWSSPKGKFAGFGKELSEALGREPASTDILKRHPFDVEIVRIPPGKAPYPFHLHSAQWEFYHVISGTGAARDGAGTTPIGPGDAFLFKPNEPHQILLFYRVHARGWFIEQQ